MTLEREVANKMEETRTLNIKMNNMKPEIMKLQRSKQQYYLYVGLGIWNLLLLTWLS